MASTSSRIRIAGNATAMIWLAAKEGWLRTLQPSMLQNAELGHLPVAVLHLTHRPFERDDRHSGIR
jgi:hypothetical protein